MSTITIQGPSKYIQGPDELTNLSEYCHNYTDGNVFILIDSYILGKYQETIIGGFDNAPIIEEFGGECSYNEIDRIIELAAKGDVGVIVGIGGGKTHDTAKAVAYNMHLPLIIVPTAASTDAPTSALSVIYSDEGEVVDYLFLRENPNLVLVDTSIIAKAPVRLLVAGIGDALATYFEARACTQSNSPNMAGGGLTSLTAMTLAELCYDTLLENGLKAKLSVEQGLSSRALMNIVEANTYLSGIGFESGGLAAAHSIHDGLTCLPETHNYYHGEKVAFGTLCQLVLENADQEEIDLFINFCQDLGLPTTLAELGVTEDVDEKVERVAFEACKEGSNIYNMPFEVDPYQVKSAILVADSLGKL